MNTTTTARNLDELVRRAETGAQCALVCRIALDAQLLAERHGYQWAQVAEIHVTDDDTLRSIEMTVPGPDGLPRVIQNDVA